MVFFANGALNLRLGTLAVSRYSRHFRISELINGEAADRPLIGNF
jgi:hypothetical protein